MVDTADVRPVVLTIGQLAKRWQVSSKTIQRHVAAGSFPIPPLLPGARLLRFAVVAVEQHERSGVSAAA